MSKFDDQFAAADAQLDANFGSRQSFVFAAHDGTQDSSGQPTYSVAGDWDTVATVEGFIGAAASGQAVRGGQIATTVTHQLRIRYSSLVAKGQRITCPNGQVLYVQGVRDPDHMQRELFVDAGLTL